MTAKVFEAALGIADPWSVASVDFDEAAEVLTVLIDFEPGQTLLRFLARGGASGARHGDQEPPYLAADCRGRSRT